jgi:hypothetical protein
MACGAKLMPVLRIVRADSRDFDIIQRLTSHFRRDLRNFFLGPNRVFHEQRLRGARAASRAVRRLRAPTHQVFRIIEVPISQAFFAISKNSIGYCGRSREPARRRAGARRNALHRGCPRGHSIHASLMWKMFFSFRCSNRDAVPTIRVGADATPPLGFGQEGSMVKKATKAKTAAKKKAPAKRKVAAKKKK